MGKIKNWTKKKAYSRMKTNGVYGWEHDNSRAAVGVLQADSNNSIGIPSGHYYVVVDDDRSSIKGRVLKRNGSNYHTRNKEEARKKAVRWMKNNPNPY